MVKKVITHECEQSKGTIVKEIGPSTQIVFTFKTFVATVIALLGIFFSFYQLVVVPRVDATEKHYTKMYDDQKQQNAIFYRELSEINASIGSLNASVGALTSSKSRTQTPRTTTPRIIPNNGVTPEVSLPINITSGILNTALNNND